ncbi:MAG: MaoC family dehydratase N-terminal domain-containing protein, partial [Proteobacteria bacterium]|nr:MaoC family dehydratase N-terminal domain-containing protein [Pseudomonadota bacterium]
MAEPAWMQEVRALVGKEYGRVYAWDPVNAPMIRQWCELMGTEVPHDEDGNVLAPPAMLQVWCMEGPVANNYPPGSTTENPYEALKLIEAQGFPSVVAVNSELTFERYLREGEKLYYTTRLDNVGEEKTTGLGTGYFVTLIMSYFSQAQAQGGQDEKVGELLFRVFKFRPANPVKPATDAPAAQPKAIPRSAPGISDDTRFFWD